MNTFSYPKMVSLGRGLSSALVAASIFVLATAAPQAQAQQSVDNMTGVDRSFGYSDMPSINNNDGFEFYNKGDPSLETFKKYLRRDNINFVIGYVTGDKPPFTKFVESVATTGAREIIQKEWGIQGKAPTNRALNQKFIQRIVAGEPQMIDAYGLGGGKELVGPVYKRAIFLKRFGAASAETVDAELTAYAKSIAKEVEGISDRVILYSMKDLPKNWPTASFPADTEVNRKFDAVIMIWPKKDRMLPMDFAGVPGNYSVLYGVNLQGYYYAAPAPAK